MDKSVFQTKYYEFAGFCLDTSNRELLKDGEHVQLTQKCFETLLFLIQNNGRMLQKEEILGSVWQESFVEEANLAQHIYMIRKAFRNAGESRKLIETIPKYGYRFVGDVSVHEGPVPPKSNGQNTPSGAFLYADMPDAPESLDILPDKKKELPGIRLSSLRRRILSVAIISAAILGVVYLAISLTSVGSPYGGIRSLAILPFEDAKQTADRRVVAGLMSSLADRLNKQEEIQISSSLQHSTGASNINETVRIGRQLGTDAVLHGSLERMNGVIHVKASILDTASGATIWSGTFGSGDEDLFILPETISKQIADTLDLGLASTTFADTIFEQPEMLDSFSAYLVGIHYFERQGPENLELAVSYLARAVEADPEFAAAAANLGDAYALIGYNRIKGYDADDSIAKAKVYSKIALDLDPASSQAVSALAMTALYERRFDDAQRLFERALRFRPDNARARQRLAWILSAQDNLDGAIHEMRRALESNPESSRITVNLARLLRLNRQADEALKYCKHALDLDPSQNSTRVILAEIYEQKGQLDQSVKELESVPRDSPEVNAANLVLGRVYAKRGEKSQARRILRDAKRSSETNTSSYEVATIYASLGDKKQAVRELQAAPDDSLIHYLHLKYDYNIDSIRKTPDYSAILTQSSKKLASRDRDGS